MLTLNIMVLCTCTKDSSGSGRPLHLWAMYCLHNGRCWFLTGLLLSGLDESSGLVLLQAEDWLCGLYVRAGGAHWATGAAKDSHMLKWTLYGLQSWWDKPLTIYKLCINKKIISNFMKPDLEPYLPAFQPVWWAWLWLWAWLQEQVLPLGECLPSGWTCSLQLAKACWGWQQLVWAWC